MAERADAAAAPGALAPRRRRALAQWLERERTFRILPLIPVQFLVLALLFVPFVLTIYISLLRWRLTRGFWTDAPWGGLSNFVDAVTDEGFIDAIGRTFAFAGVAVVFELAIGFGLALLTYRAFRGRRFYFTVFLIPMMIIPVVVGYDFSMLLIDTGPLNAALSALTGFEHPPALAVRLPRRPGRGDHRRHLAVDAADVPDLRLRAVVAARRPDQGRPGHGGKPLAGVPPRGAAAAQARDRDRAWSSGRWRR